MKGLRGLANIFLKSHTVAPKNLDRGFFSVEIYDEILGANYVMHLFTVEKKSDMTLDKKC